MELILSAGVLRQFPHWVAPNCHRSTRSEERVGTPGAVWAYVEYGHKRTPQFHSANYVAAKSKDSFELIDPATEDSYGASPISYCNPTLMRLCRGGHTFEWGETTLLNGGSPYSASQMRWKLVPRDFADAESERLPASRRHPLVNDERYWFRSIKSDSSPARLGISPGMALGGAWLSSPSIVDALHRKDSIGQIAVELSHQHGGLEDCNPQLLLAIRPCLEERARPRHRLFARRSGGQFLRRSSQRHGRRPNDRRR